jgi:hypothetical protein
MTISQIKNATLATSPYFFTKETLRFFGQKMSSFSVKKQPDGRVKISAPMFDRSGRNVGQTIRFFNPLNNKLETI